LILAAFVAVAVPPASTWLALFAEAGLFLVACSIATWLLNRELVQYLLRGARARE
jgi:hypothetical protein